tara:strand:+ start:211 stop:393 length:183 start_codon:yes stop_codon:yes gene_type:complete
MNWTILLITFLFFSIVILAMSIGYIVAGKKLQGSCGGLGSLMGKDCDFCEKKDQCKKDEG